MVYDVPKVKGKQIRQVVIRDKRHFSPILHFGSMESNLNGSATDEEKIFLKMLHEVFEAQMSDNNKSHTHIVNGNTHFDYSNLNRDKKKMFNSKILTFRRKCKPTGISLGDMINEAEEKTSAALEAEKQKLHQKQKNFLSKTG